MVLPDGSCQQFRWGWKVQVQPGKQQLVFNARAESLWEKASFRPLLDKYRCLVPADAFYEFEHRGKEIRPLRFALKTESLMLFAGLFNPEHQSFTIITTQPNELVRGYHDRMPVMLDRENALHWVAPDSKPADLSAHLQPYEAAKMHAYYTHPALCNPAYEGEQYTREYHYQELF